MSVVHAKVRDRLFKLPDHAVFQNGFRATNLLSGHLAAVLISIL